MSRPLLGSMLAIIVLLVSLRNANAQDTVGYTVNLNDPTHHLVRVVITVPPGRATHELQLPVWNALYQVRDFSQYMNWIRAEDLGGHALTLTQLNPSRWKVTGSVSGARIEYEMFCDDPGPFGAELNSHHAFFNLAELLVYVEDARSIPQQIEFTSLPVGWRIATALVPEGERYRASDYDQLVDSPVEISDFTEQDFSAVCGTHRVVLDSSNASHLIGKIVPQIQHIVNEASQWMNDCPFKTYTFIYHFSDSVGGGMEHAYSTAITVRPRSLEGDMSGFDFVTAHEFFHLWDVKRIRPQSLEPIDYTRENYTTALWFSEGVDSTAAECILLRTGLMDEQRYLKHLGEAITEIENTPARRTQSVEQSSLDAWLEKYPYYGLPDRSISYYTKGELLGVLLDLRMRAASQDRASLQTLFRWMNQHYAKEEKFFADSLAVREAAESVSGADLSGFFRDYVAGTSEIPWNDFFEYVGLRVQSSQVSVVDPGFDAVQKFDQPPVVVRVKPGSPAEHAGLRSGDVLTAINGTRDGRDFERDIEVVGQGGLLRLRITRDGEEHELQFTLGSAQRTVFRLEDAPGVTAEQRQHRQRWLFGSDDDATAQLKPGAQIPSDQLHPQTYRSPDVPIARSPDAP